MKKIMQKNLWRNAILKCVDSKNTVGNRDEKTSKLERNYAIQ